MSTIKPLGERVLIQRVAVGEQQTDGGVYIPTPQREDGTYKAEVVAVGEEVTKVKAGDLILISQYSGDRAQDDSAEEYIILEEKDILATVDRS